eukprot:Tamp_06234.p1 GENE.Tamp_06234~~Tamp_06234.p1  ORF type:complete len:549 (+),score=86.53 Tamp_06234:857-2503(+)
MDGIVVGLTSVTVAMNSSTDLQLYLAGLESDARTRRRCRRRLLCRTLAGNRCELLTITGNDSVSESQASHVSGGGYSEWESTLVAPDNGKESHGEDTQILKEQSAKERVGQGTSEEGGAQNQQCRQKKPCIVLSARVHPGETNASWMMKGCLEYLVGDSPGARRLRSQYVFKVVPMLNPDGVIVGNYRTGLAGCDLNRKWKQPCKTMQPTIYYMRQMMEEMRHERGIALFVDLHGHSVKKNVFMYGCDAKHFNDAPNHPSRPQPFPFDSRMFPAQMEHVCNKFNFLDCRFHVKRKKESTGRVVAWRQFTNCSYTLESSFGGADAQHEPCSSHFGVEDYLQIGQDLCAALEQYLCVDVVEKETLHSALRKQVAETVIPDDDDDSDGEDRKADRISSDDDSDDNTVEAIVLPSRSNAPCAKAKKKKEKIPGKTPQKAAPKKGQKKFEDNKPNPKLIAKKERPQSARQDQPRIAKEAVSAAKEPPEKAEKHPEKPNPPPCVGGHANAQCDCPSCQVFDDFLSESMLATALKQLQQAHVDDIASRRDGSDPA